MLWGGGAAKWAVFHMMGSEARAMGRFVDVVSCLSVRKALGMFHICTSHDRKIGVDEKTC